MSFLDEKNVLITGASGLICSHLVENIINHSNANIYVLGRSLTKLQTAFSKYDQERIHYLAQNVSDELLIGKRVDYIFHGAGPIDGATIRNYPMDVISPNMQGLINCCELIKRQNLEYGTQCRLIVFSSATVYGNPAGVDSKVTEENTCNALGLNSVNAPYSESKRMAEVIARAMATQYGIDAVIVRFSYVYGSTDFPPIQPSTNLSRQ